MSTARIGLSKAGLGGLGLGILFGSGCLGPPPVALVPAPALTAIETGELEVTVFLIGDAGHAEPGDRVLAELTRQGKAAPRGSVIVFLGDNVYPDGVPADTAPNFRAAQRHLYTQAEVGLATGLRVIFLPGNHDWDRQRDPGWAKVQRQGLLLRRYADSTGASVELQPGAGCPGPVVTRVGRQLRLAVIDTPWWLQTGSRPGFEPEVREPMLDTVTVCHLKSKEAVLDSLRRLHQSDDGLLTITAGHQPIESHGEHGGYHPWTQYIFPLVPTPIAPWLWLPIGWIYPVGRKLRSHPQDIASSKNRVLREAIASTFSDRGPLVYAAGHDHSLEVMRRGPRGFHLVSGSGTENHQSAVGQGDSTAFRSDRPGFMRVDALVGGRIRLGVTTLDAARRPREAYQAWLKP